MKKTTIGIFTVDWERLKKIKAKHGFPNYAETVGYVLQKFPEMIVEEKGIVPAPVEKIAPIVDAEKAQKEKNLAPIRNNEFVEIGAIQRKEHEL